DQPREVGHRQLEGDRRLALDPWHDAGGAILHPHRPARRWLPVAMVLQLVRDVALESEGELRLELPGHAGEDGPLGDVAPEAALELCVAGAADEPGDRLLATPL